MMNPGLVHSSDFWHSLRRWRGSWQRHDGTRSPLRRGRNPTRRRGGGQSGGTGAGFGQRLGAGAVKTTHSRVGAITVRTRSRSPLRTFPQLRLGRACRGRSWLRPAGENAAVRVRCEEDRGFGGGRKHTSRPGLFGARATRCSGPGPVVSAAGEVSVSERMPGRTRNQAGLADVTEASAHRADAGSRRRSGCEPIASAEGECTLRRLVGAVFRSVRVLRRSGGR